jgi:hypothetical protein
MLTHSTLNEFSTNVVSTLSLVLVDDLGKYDISGAQVPAIWVTPPDVPQSYSVVPGSGVEVIFSIEPDIPASNLMGRMGQELLFPLLLRQWDSSKSIAPAVQKVLLCKQFVIHNPPTIRPYAEVNGEIYYSQARIFLSATQLESYV